MSNDSLKKYATERQKLLEVITRFLSMDERFAAAWLTGSLARGEADEVSDLDLTVVVREPFNARLCERQEQVSGTTLPARLELFRRFGEPAVIHENHNNAPAGGTFTFVLYAGSAVMIDWVLLPLDAARRPEDFRLLFDHAGIPLRKPKMPGTSEQRMEKIREMTAFFWMMTAVTIKYIHRGDGVFVQTWLENLTGLVNEIERLVEGRPATYHRGSWTKLRTSRDKQIQAIQNLSSRMQELMAQANELGVSLPPAPMNEIEILLSQPV